MFVYVLDKEQWIETESLFLHDIALLIDNKLKKGYLWFGPRSAESDRDRATKLASEIMDKYSMYELIVLGQTVPLKIDAEIEQLLGENADPIKLKVDRTKSMQLFVYIGLASIIAMLVLVLCNMGMFGWDSVNGYYQVDVNSYNTLIQAALDIGYVAIAIYIVELFLAVLNMKIYLVVTAAAGLGMAIGSWFYLAQGQFLFEFLQGAPLGYFWIRVGDVVGNIFWLLLVWVVSTGITIYAILAIKNTTEFKEKEIHKEIASVKPSLIREDTVEIQPL
jgi:hypothetical protein